MFAVRVFRTLGGPKTSEAAPHSVTTRVIAAVADNLPTIPKYLIRPPITEQRTIYSVILTSMTVHIITIIIIIIKGYRILCLFFVFLRKKGNIAA